MSKKQNLASFCRLCLVKTTNKVPVFGGEQENVTNLLALIELNINPELEPNAVVCYECILTLEAFFQFKEKCHANEEFLKTVPKDGYKRSKASKDAAAMECEYLEDGDHDYANRNSEERGLVEDVDVESPPEKPKNKSPKKKATKAKAEKGPKKRRTWKRRTPSPEPAPNKVFIPKFPGPQPTDDELPKLQDSYPEYLHFERRKNTVYFDLVYYGERFNSAIYTPNYTYWQCAERRKGKCPAQVFVTNDYTEFERRFEHSHVAQNRKRRVKVKPEMYTPKQALPAVFRICWYRVKQRQIRNEEAKRAKMGLKEGEASGDSHAEKILLDELIEYDGPASDNENNEDI